MKIEYEIDKEEFSTLMAAINNGLHSLQSTYLSLILGCEVPLVFEKLSNLSYEELQSLTEIRMKSYIKFYNYLEKLEKENS